MKNKNIKLIEKGKCPFCKKKVYTPSSPTVTEHAYYIAVGMHMPTCKKNPDYKESEIEKFMRELLE